MGKHERQQIEEAEKIVVTILNGHQPHSFDRKNLWFNHALLVAKKIQQDFPKITKAYHLGNRYDNTGDILIISSGKKFYLEIKMSQTKTGVGTRANISQDALTENDLFKEKVKSWSKFREERKYGGKSKKNTRKIFRF